VGLLEDILVLGIVVVIGYFAIKFILPGLLGSGLAPPATGTGVGDIGRGVRVIGKDKSGNDMIYATTGKEWHSGLDWRGMYFPPTGSPNVGRGGAVLTIKGTSPRLTIGGGWESTEITFWVKGKADWIAIHGGSDHHDKKGTKKNTWGGYAQKIYVNKSDAGVQKEPTHGTYCRAKKKGSQGTAYKFSQDSFTGLKGIQKVEGDKVILEAYINEGGSGWKPLFKEEDTGNFPCGKGEFKEPQTGGGEIIWIRFNGADLQIKNLSVREIGGGGGGGAKVRGGGKESAYARAYLSLYAPRIPISLSS
jgi:hypothetical protein